MILNRLEIVITLVEIFMTFRKKTKMTVLSWCTTCDALFICSLTVSLLSFFLSLITLRWWMWAWPRVTWSDLKTWAAGILLSWPTSLSYWKVWWYVAGATKSPSTSAADSRSPAPCCCVTKVSRPTRQPLNICFIYFLLIALVPMSPAGTDPAL